MTNEIKNVPELRFPEFKEEWVEKKLGEITSKISDGIHSTPTYDSNGDIYFINGNNLVNGRIDFKTSKKISVQEFNKYKNYLEAKNTLLLSINGTIGNIAKYEGENILLGKSAAYINVVSKFISRCYIFYYLQISKIYESFLRELTGTTIKNLSLKSIKNIIVYISELDEQQKIGNFFSKLDRQIELEEQKLSLLEEQKKGYMQQIFSRQFLFENEKGDTDYSWRNFKIKDIFSKIESGNRLPKTNLVEGNIPYVIAQTTNNGVFMHISEDTLDYHKNKLKLFKKGSITISIDNPEAMFIQEMDFFTSNVMRVIHNENLKRGSHIFIMESLKKLTQSYNWSVKFSGPIIMDSTVKFPVYNDNKVNWNVVNKIGDFFNTFEIRINRQSDKIKLLEERKKGFLQKMFI
ncbi:restriction endonuclease subunit S [Staphylococcus cohnii]|uniref:restriction endonuclease subunit S n=1 Tax=Staphylococcus cohnii TaxID=29382 RepID=UPI003AF4C5C5